MCKKHHGVTTAFLACKIKKLGKHYDKNGVYLRVGKNGRCYWEQRLTVNGHRRTIGIGPYPVVSLKMARVAGLDNLRLVYLGQDPLAFRDESEKAPPFATLATEMLEILRPTWSDPKQPQVWMSSLERLVFPAIGDRSVSDLKTLDIVAVLKPFWYELPETAKRVRQRIRSVMELAVAHGYRIDNPAGAAVDVMLRPTSGVKAHMRAIPHSEVADAIVVVRRTDAWPATKWLFEFIVLTASRSGEGRGAHWSEFDLENRVWTIPLGRMKAKREHRVPLSDRALDILDEARLQHGSVGLVFPSKNGRKISDATIPKLLRENGIDAVLHGFRSSFRNWCTETEVTDRVAEECLAHVIRSKTKKAYDRTDVLDPRRKVMEDWASYIAS